VLDQTKRRLQLEIRIERIALRVEHVDRIKIANCQPERVQINRRTNLVVHAAEVDDELTVDEDPHVVVAEEAERLASRVREVDVVLGREEEVVQLAVGVWRQLIESVAVHREVCAALESVDWRALSLVVLERDVGLVAHVDARHVSEPLRKQAAVVEHARADRLTHRQCLAARAAVAKAAHTHGLAVGAESRRDHARCGNCRVHVAEEVRVVGIEVAVHDLHDGVHVLLLAARWRRRRPRLDRQVEVVKDV